MTARHYRDAAGNYLGCHIASDAVDPVTGKVTAPEAPWPGAIAIDAPPSHALMVLKGGTWTETEASLAAKGQP